MTVAVLIPCYNEELTIGKVVRDFRKIAPDAAIFVYDNNSTDNTRKIAEREGAFVVQETHRGKGNVVRRMFADIEADIYVLVDGDDTYEAEKLPYMLQMVRDMQLDMVNGARMSVASEAYRPGHRFGNAMLSGIVKFAFTNEIRDLLSGYRVFSRRFVKSFPALSKGFEIETELTVHALELRMPIAEVDILYRPRPEGSSSKLKTIRDGLRILVTIMRLLKEERPLTFYGLIALALSTTSIGLAWPIFIQYMETGLVPRFPTAILSTGIMILAFLSLAVGFILDSVTHGRRELKRLFYLGQLAPESKSQETAKPRTHKLSTL